MQQDKDEAHSPPRSHLSHAGAHARSRRPPRHRRASPASRKGVGPSLLRPLTCTLTARSKVRGRGAVMAALCRARAATAESRFLRGFPFRRPCRGTGTGSSSGSESPDAAEPEMRQGGFASALERHSKLRRKAELGEKPVSEPRRSGLRCEGSRGAGGVGVGGRGSRGGAWRRGGAGSRGVSGRCGGPVAGDARVPSLLRRLCFCAAWTCWTCLVHAPLGECCGGGGPGRASQTNRTPPAPRHRPRRGWALCPRVLHTQELSAELAVRRARPAPC